MPQFLRPISDLVTNANWTTTPYWDALDEVSFSDADFVSCGNSNNATFEIGLSSADSPQAGTRTLRIRCKKGGSGGNQRGLDYNLKEGGTSIQTGTVNATLTDVYSTVEIVISNSITNYSTLSLELSSTGTTTGPGGNRRTVEVSWVEFEIPDKVSSVFNLNITETVDLIDSNTSTYIGSLSLVETSDIVEINIGGIIFNDSITFSIDGTDNLVSSMSYNDSIVFTVNGVSDESGGKVISENITFTVDNTDSYQSEISVPSTLIIRFKNVSTLRFKINPE